MDTATRALLAAAADEATAVSDGIEAVSSLTTRLILATPAEDRGAAMAEAQAFDLLAQRMEALSAVLMALASGQTPEAAVHAITLSDLAARLAGRDPSTAAGAPGPGDCLLFG